MFRKGTVENLITDMMEELDKKSRSEVRNSSTTYPLDLDEIYDALKEVLKEG